MENLETISEVELIYKSNINLSERMKITCSNDVYEVFKKIDYFIRHIEYKEIFYCLFLNKANKILSVQKISEGSTSGSCVDIKFIFQSMILQNASSLIIAHNHPSGNLKPSNEDISITKRIQQACFFFGLNLHDHIILSKENYFSFADEGTINFND